MTRYARVPVAAASDPVPGMRVYGRAEGGAPVVVVVHWVENGNVYVARRFRGERLRDLVRWPLCRFGLGDWRRAVAGADLIGVKVPGAGCPAESGVTR